jgi:hypothetical protein
VHLLAATVVTTTVAAFVVEDGGSAAASTTAASQRANPVTPGNFTGYGFDQCLAPTQRTMDRWLQNSPFLAVGIYISGASRGCRDQPNLTPTWVRTQLARGWRLLPITLGPQASCQPRFPRYGNDPTISAKPGPNTRFPKARKQGVAEAAKTVRAATRLGITKGSTLWYDIEGFDSTKFRCRESALRFLHGWTRQIHRLGYVSGVYSSAGSGIKMLDDARVKRPGQFALPDQIWIARWDGKANTSTSYIREDGWQPHKRIKQYQGGHNETWGGVRINIDRNYLDVGRGSIARRESHCGGTQIGFGIYPRLTRAGLAKTPRPVKVQALQCLLTEKGLYSGKLTGTLTNRTIRAFNTWQKRHGFAARPIWNRRDWITLLSAGSKPVVKIGSSGPAVRRLQRSLNAALKGTPRLSASGVFDPMTRRAVVAYQRRMGLWDTGIVGSATWPDLAAGHWPR